VLSLLALLLASLVAVGPSAAQGGAPPVSFTPLARLGGASLAAAANERYAFVGDGQGVVVYDIAGTTPAGVVRWALPGLVQDMALSGDLLAVGAGSSLLLYRLDGRTILASGRYDAGAEVHGVALTPGRAYLGTAAGLEVVDIGAIERPARLGALARTRGVNQILAEGTTLYATTYPEGIDGLQQGSVIKVDTANPATPQVLAEGRLSDLYISNGDALVRFGATIFVLGDTTGRPIQGNYGFTIWAFAADTLAPVGSPNSFGLQVQPEDGTDLAVYGDYLLALSTRGGLSVIDPSDPAALQLVRRVELGPDRSALAIAGARAFAAIRRGGVQAISLADPRNPAPGTAQPLLGPVVGAGLFGGALTTLSPDSAGAGLVLTSFDIRSPAAPIPGEQRAIGAESELRPGENGIHLVYDRSTDLTRLVDGRVPGQVRLSGTLRLGPTDAVAGAGQLAYVGVAGPSGSGPFELATVSLANLAAPEVVGRLGVLSSTLDLEVADGRLYRLDAGARLRIYSLANPLAPAQVGQIALGESYTNFAVAGGAAYVALPEGVRVVDVRNPAAPALGPLIGAGLTYPRVSVSGGRLVAAEDSCQVGACDLQLFSLADPLAPAPLGTTAIPAGVAGVAASEGRFVAVLGEQGAVVYAALERRLWLPALRR